MENWRREWKTEWKTESKTEWKNIGKQNRKENQKEEINIIENIIEKNPCNIIEHIYGTHELHGTIGTNGFSEPGHSPDMLQEE